MVQNLEKAELDSRLSQRTTTDPMQQKPFSWNFSVKKVCATHGTPGFAEAKARAIPNRCCSLSDSLRTHSRPCALCGLRGLHAARLSMLHLAAQSASPRVPFSSLQEFLHLLRRNSEMMQNDATCKCIKIKMLRNIAELCYL